MNPDQQLANVVSQAGLEDLAKAIQGNTNFHCVIEITGDQRCAELAEIHRRQQLFSDAAAIALALSFAAIVGEIAVIFVAVVGARYRRLRSTSPLDGAVARHDGVLTDG